MPGRQAYTTLCVCSRRQRLHASEFIAGNKDQLEALHAMGIRIATMSDGRIQLLHTASEVLIAMLYSSLRY